MRLEADRLAEESAARRAAAQARREEEAAEEAPSSLSPAVSPMPSVSSPSPLPSTSLPPTLLSEAAAADEAPRGLPTTTTTESGGSGSLIASPQPTYESLRDTAPDSEPADAVEAPAQQRDWAEERRQKRLQWEEEREQARQAHEAEMEARNAERLAARAARQQAAAELELQVAAAGPEPEPERQDGLPSSSFGRSPISLIPTRSSTLTPMVSRPFPSWNRSILTEIYLCHTCSYHKIEDGNGPDRERAQW
eukprot:COSAG01_NODE_1511_length_10068_cov_7.643731_14_plen_251_part_00